MRLEESLQMTPSEFPMVSFLDKLTPQYWALKNALDSISIKPVTALAITHKQEAVSEHKDHTMSLPSLSEIVVNEALINKYIRKGQRLQSEQLAIIVKAFFNGAKAVGKALFRIFTVQPEELHKRPFVG